jgi:demethylmenaquinone methyltransferase/2-methoxy-6-polyprenyl-1,4-benzoquinol methylase
MPVDKSGERVKRMFGAIAGKYDRMNHLLSMNVDSYWRRWTVQKLRPSGAEPILDVCTGTGDLALAFWRATDGSVPIVATDFCREMLDIGQQKKEAAGINGALQFIEADTLQLPFSDDYFQLVTVAFGLRNVTDTQRGIREMIRVRQPNGRIAILEFSMPRWQPFRSVYGWYFRSVLPRIGQLLTRNDEAAYSYLPDSVNEFPYGERLAERLREAGLRNVQYFPLTLGIATLYVGTKP